MQDADMIGQLVYPGEIRKYILGGNSTFTLRSVQDPTRRFTYKVKSSVEDRANNWSTGNQNKNFYFVSLLTGGDNESSYTYMGVIERHGITGEYLFRTTAKSTIKGPPLDVFIHMWKGIENCATLPSNMEFWHEGICCMCGRKLTVPSSVEAGIGPECATKE